MKDLEEMLCLNIYTNDSSLDSKMRVQGTKCITSNLTGTSSQSTQTELKYGHFPFKPPKHIWVQNRAL